MTKHYLTINNKKHPYTIEKRGGKITKFTCKSANINQEFLNEDIPGLLIDLPHLIIAEQEDKSEIIRFRISSADKQKIKAKAVAKGYNSISSYLRDLALS
ncbi:hypothetical protein KJ632_00110 [Patescibacteria group bacterium]|nr:hypothetical protein [Patescibacteria group bacterium]